MTARRAETTPAFAQMRDRINKTLMGQRVRTLLEEQMQGISEALRHGKSIEDVAKERGFTVDRSAPLARGVDTPPLNSSALVARAFELKRGETEPEPFQLATGCHLRAGRTGARAPTSRKSGPREGGLSRRSFEAARGRPTSKARPAPL